MPRNAVQATPRTVLAIKVPRVPEERVLPKQTVKIHPVGSLVSLNSKASASSGALNSSKRPLAYGLNCVLEPLFPTLAFGHPLFVRGGGEGNRLGEHFFPIFCPAFPFSAIGPERSSPSRNRFPPPNNGPA